MNLEFAGRFNRPDLVIKEFKYWVVIIRENVVTLGSSIFVLKSGKKNLSDVSSLEMAEFSEVCRWFEDKTKNLYEAVKWNYLALMMKDEFVHFHAIPRYSTNVLKYNMMWVDKDYPKGTKLEKIEIDNSILLEILNDMKKNRQLEILFSNCI